jgi:hypothetical protein
VVYLRPLENVVPRLAYAIGEPLQSIGGKLGGLKAGFVNTCELI